MVERKINVGVLIWDYALGRHGIVVGDAWIQPPDSYDIMSREIPWEWRVLYDNGEFMGADTNDLMLLEETA